METTNKLHSLSKEKAEKERLEISSTGYGLESVTYPSKINQTEQGAAEAQKPSCGGV